MVTPNRAVLRFRLHSKDNTSLLITYIRLEKSSCKMIIMSFICAIYHATITRTLVVHKSVVVIGQNKHQ